MIHPKLQVALKHLGITQAKTLAHELNISQPTLSRLIRQAGDRIVRIGRARATRYALSLDLPERRIPLYRINAKAQAEKLAWIFPLYNGFFWIEALTTEKWLLGERNDGVFEDLPYFLRDLRPQGFLGRLTAKKLTLGYPKNPEQWNSTNILHYLLNYGEQLPGDLVLGEKCLIQAFQSLAQREEKNRQSRYPELAIQALHGEPVGSFAGGEQPKFTTFVHDTPPYHAIVKFSPLTKTPAGRRWADLLRAEHLALETLRQAGLKAAQSTIIDAACRTFLEVKRFDRIEKNGRLPIFSLEAIDMEYIGQLNTWRATANALAEQQLLSEQEAKQIIIWEFFAELIANTDRHFGNVSLTLTQTGTFTLAPVYDMLPMYFAPIRDELITRPPWQPVQRNKNEYGWQQALTLAINYWQRVSQDTGISKNFRIQAKRCYKILNLNFTNEI